jgi:hypothetical protein
MILKKLNAATPILPSENLSSGTPFNAYIFLFSSLQYLIHIKENFIEDTLNIFLCYGTPSS